MEPLKYSPDLTTATSIAPAFKFADQMIVHFACRVTLCTREQLGCEGITPPVCQFLPLPPNIPYSDVSPTSATNAYFQSTTTKMPLLPLPNSERILQPSSTLTATIATPSTKSSRRAAATTTGAFGMRTSKTTSQYPSNAYGVPISSDSNTNYFFDYDAGTVREKQPNWPRHARRAPNNETRSADDSMTFDVSAAQMIVFSRDETERQPTVVDAFGECRIVQMPAIVFAIALFALFMLSTALLCLQKRFYEKRLLKCSFSPNFEMLRVKNF
ncbi:unnamed protein product [Toxocara canis]|uniref:ZP domain-containing protein n=1 Tax=Toxocara canis TaxID=6265 RepID=A0A183VC04_TOXCA|nr:unnamed protein product [Toxocara canis]